MEKLSYFLRMPVLQNQEKKETWTGQSACIYIKKLLATMKMSVCKLVMTPVVPGSFLMKATKKEEACRSTTMSITYSEPIVSYTVVTLARFSSKPNQPTG